MSDPDSHSTPPDLRLVSKPEYDRGDHHLTIEVLRALRRLERRMRSGHFDPVNIRDVQQLAALGLAQHGRGGWRPTAEGLAYLDLCESDNALGPESLA